MILADLSMTSKSNRELAIWFNRCPWSFCCLSPIFSR